MKFLAVLFFACITAISHAQFKVGAKNMCPMRDVLKSSEMAENTDAKGLDIYIMEFDYDENVAIKTFEELECIHFEFAFSPESSDLQKEAFIADLKMRLAQLEFLLRSPKLKNVYFHIGEQIFMRKSEVNKAGDSWKKRAETNLNNAWKSFGAQLKTTYPHLQFYAENWNW